MQRLRNPGVAIYKLPLGEVTDHRVEVVLGRGPKRRVTLIRRRGFCLSNSAPRLRLHEHAEQRNVTHPRPLERQTSRLRVLTTSGAVVAPNPRGEARFERRGMDRS